MEWNELLNCASSAGSTNRQTASPAQLSLVPGCCVNDNSEKVWVEGSSLRCILKSVIRHLVFVSSLIAITTHAASLGESRIFMETCDASAVVAVSDDLFAVANDEDNVVRFYRWSQPGKPVHTSNLNPLFFGKKKSPELDIEAAARLGNRVFWITSHGRNAKGELAPGRSRLFALEITNSNAAITVSPVTGFYTNLLSDLAREPKLAGFNLTDAAKSAPKTSGALNIEALTSTPQGSLLIGFRNPIPKGRALIVPLFNPNGVLSGEPPRFGEAILLDLGGLGLRGMESTHDGYYLLAGPADGGVASRLFFWAGGNAVPKPVAGVNFTGINPEGICLVNAKKNSDLLFLSDDGSRELHGKECKDLPESQRQFRAYRMAP